MRLADCFSPLSESDFDRTMLEAIEDNSSGARVNATVLRRLIDKGYIRILAEITPEGKRFLEGH